MALKPGTEVRAVAVLTPSGGRSRAAPSSANIADWKPTAAALKTAIAALEKLGFTVTKTPGGALDVSAAVKTFESVFGVKLAEAANGGIAVQGGGVDLPLAKLPDALREQLHAIGFEQPPDFGPTGFF